MSGMSARLKAYRDRLRLLTSPAPMNEFSDYDAYWTERQDLNVIQERWRIASEVIREGATVLDVGCGSGEFLSFLQRTRPDLKASGADYSPVSVEMTKERGFDAFQLDLANDTIPSQYDYVTCFETIEHIPDAERAIVNLRDAFREQLIVSIPNVGAIDYRIRLGLFGRFPVTSCVFHIKEHVRFWTFKDFHEWVAHFGLRVVKAQGHIGGALLPWRRRPALWSAGVVYILERY